MKCRGSPEEEENIIENKNKNEAYVEFQTTSVEVKIRLSQKKSVSYTPTTKFVVDLKRFFPVEIFAETQPHQTPSFLFFFSNI